jgi:hypothetical protein
VRCIWPRAAPTAIAASTPSEITEVLPLLYLHDLSRDFVTADLVAPRAGGALRG